MQNRLASCLLASAFSITGALAKDPVIKKETREVNGKQVEYMFIDGIKVHETDPEKMQDHGNPVRFRNIWIQKVED